MDRIDTMNRITQATFRVLLKQRFRLVAYLNLVNLVNPVQYCSLMTPELFREIIAAYQRHGWELRRVLLKPKTRSDLGEQAAALFDEAKLIESEIDALWFARPSHAGREAWELRLVEQQPYALFEAFEADETEEEREEARIEMENKMREYQTQT
jgi:hypothetical protein